MKKNKNQMGFGVTIGAAIGMLLLKKKNKSED